MNDRKVFVDRGGVFLHSSYYNLLFSFFAFLQKKSFVFFKLFSALFIKFFNIHSF